MMQIRVMADILEDNTAMAQAVRERLDECGIFVLNLMGSPGCGKTSLLEKTAAALRDELRMAVIEGDLYTAQDAERISRHFLPVVQINTEGGCHLNAKMIERALEDLPLAKLDLLIIENVGNLVCPAEFDIGEDAKAVVLSVTEGEDKPLKYPLAFTRAAITIINKIDLLPYLDFDLQKAETDIAALNPKAGLLELSCRSGEGLDDWFDWLRRAVQEKKARRVGANVKAGRAEN